MTQKSWFEVDRKGLRALVKDKGWHRLLFELVSNAWDETGVTHVSVRVAGDGPQKAVIEVEDDAPNGFRDLKEAFTIFSPSYKAPDAGKRGRFNLGEKLVLACCREAEIISTKGTIRFSPEKGRTTGRTKRSRGTLFRAWVQMTKAEVHDCRDQLKRLIPPPSIETFVEGVRIIAPPTTQILSVILPTVGVDGEGVLRQTIRKTQVIVRPGSPGWLYEMGIPVCEIGGTYSADVGQKVPLPMDRDTVSPRYLEKIRGAIIDAVGRRLDEHEAKEDWVTQGLKEAKDHDSIRAVISSRFGKKAVIQDPSDPEGTKLAASKGYTVVPGGSLSAEAWKNVKASEALKPAGQVTPSNSHVQFSATGKDVSYPIEKWTEEMTAVVRRFRRLGSTVLNTNISVGIVNDPRAYNACYGSRTLTLNIRKLGKAWFEGEVDSNRHLRLLIHELAHEVEEDHLSERYHDVLCQVGARLAQVMVREAQGKRQGVTEEDPSDRHPLPRP